MRKQFINFVITGKLLAEGTSTQINWISEDRSLLKVIISYFYIDFVILGQD